MTKKVYVTPAQRDAARQLVERADKTRRWVAPEVRMIAEAEVEPKNESNSPSQTVVSESTDR